jgi:hypothetical protein
MPGRRCQIYWRDCDYCGLLFPARTPAQRFHRICQPLALVEEQNRRTREQSQPPLAVDESLRVSADDRAGRSPRASLPRPRLRTRWLAQEDIRVANAASPEELLAIAAEKGIPLQRVLERHSMLSELLIGLERYRQQGDRSVVS